MGYDCSGSVRVHLEVPVEKETEVMRSGIVDFLNHTFHTDIFRYLVPVPAVIYALAICVIGWIFVKRCERSGLSAYHALGCSLWGVMGGMLAEKLAEAGNQLLVSDVAGDKLQKLGQQSNIFTSDKNSDAVDFGEVVIVAVKPQQFDSVVVDFEQIKSSDTIIISVLAGTPKMNTSNLP